MRSAPFALLASVALLLAACSKTPHVKVGSKRGTEQVILGEIIAQHLSHRLDEPVDKNFEMGETESVHTALISGELDLYPEYSGSALTNIIKTAMSSKEPTLVYDRVQTVYRDQYALRFMPPLGFVSRTGAVVTAKTAADRKVTNLSQAEAMDGMVLAYSGDFNTRPDGMPVLMSSYRLPVKGLPVLSEPKQIYSMLRNGQVSFIMARNTDGALRDSAFQFIEDDRNVFPPYQAGVAVRKSSLSAHPKLESALHELEGKISLEQIRSMNAQVDIDHKPAASVAADFLNQAGLK